MNASEPGLIGGDQFVVPLSKLFLIRLALSGSVTSVFGASWIIIASLSVASISDGRVKPLSSETPRLVLFTPLSSKSSAGFSETPVSVPSSALYMSCKVLGVRPRFLSGFCWRECWRLRIHHVSAPMPRRAITPSGMATPRAILFAVLSEEGGGTATAVLLV